MTSKERRQAGVDLLTELRDRCRHAGGTMHHNPCDGCACRDFCVTMAHTSPNELTGEQIKNIVDVIIG